MQHGASRKCHPLNIGEKPEKLLGAAVKFRKTVSTAIIAGMFFWAPSVIPVRASTSIGCGIPLAWTTMDTAFAGVQGEIPCPPVHTPLPWVVILFGAAAVSVILNAAIVSHTQCRELSQQEAWSSIFMPFLGIAFNQHNNMCNLQPHHHR